MLSDRIDSEMKEAQRAQDKRRLGTLRMLKSALKYREIETGKALEDAEVIGVVQTLIKQRRDSAAQYKAGGRPELADNENAEIVILEAFLPRQLTDAELRALVLAFFAGKMSVDDAPAVRALIEEGLVARPRFVPDWWRGRARLALQIADAAYAEPLRLQQAARPNAAAAG